MQLRPYQHDAVEGVFTAWRSSPATLVVMPTGTGKTVMFAEIISRRPPGRVMMIAHREELIWQGTATIQAVTGIKPDVEMAEMVARSDLFGKSPVVVSSVQTQCAGLAGEGRMTRFDPAEFGLLVIDEAHHATADTYRRVIDYYRQNPALKVLGVTATPDRHDEAALGQVFKSVAYDYELTDAIRDGWLVPVRQRAVVVDGLDYSSVRTTAGDLNGADLARVMEFEEVLHGIAGPTIELAAGRRTLVFAASVAHAERLCEIFNRHKTESARFVTGKTPKVDRRQMFIDYAAGRFQILCNVGVATEGFDEPGIELVVMARPTKSRALYAQMAGRGTRALPGVVDGPETPELRHEAIAASAKPHVEIVDFVGNSGRHKLISAADILGGKYADEIIERAKKTAEESDGAAVDVEHLLQDAERDIHEEHEKARRAAIRAKARYTTSTVDPFDVLGIEPQREKGWNTGRRPTEKMIELLEKQGVATKGLSFSQASQLIGAVTSRWDGKQCSFKQARVLSKYGYATDVGFKEASQLIDAIAKNGWRRPEAASQGEATQAPVKVY